MSSTNLDSSNTLENTCEDAIENTLENTLENSREDAIENDTKILKQRCHYPYSEEEIKNASTEELECRCYFLAERYDFGLNDDDDEHEKI